jgi:hypothetical protein
MATAKSTKSNSTSKTPAAAPLVRPGSKLAKLLALMQRPQGATVEELARATNWQKHTVRGAISGNVKKKLHQRVTLLDRGGRHAYAITRPRSRRFGAKNDTSAKLPKAAPGKAAVAEPAAE